MNLIERNKDVLTGSRDLEKLHSLMKFPVFMGCVDHPRIEDLFAELTWQISKESGFLQVAKLIPLDILYQSQHVSSVGKIWLDHHRKFSQFLKNQNPSDILELGGAHGKLSKEYHAQFGQISWTIVEPNPSPVDGCEARFIKGFFDEKFTYDQTFDTVVHSHVFEHIYDPDQFMYQLSSFIDSGKNFIFSVPNLKEWLKRKYPTSINFEHTTFLTESYIEFLLAKHGFKLTQKEYFMEEHSIFYATIRDLSVKKVELPSSLYEKNKKLFLDYVYYHEDLVENLNKRINETVNPIYLFGAHIFSQYLIVTGLDTSRVVCLLDNDINKQGKRLYGTNLMVQSPNILRNIKDPVIILKAGVYNQEIKEDIVSNINNKANFI